MTEASLQELFHRVCLGWLWARPGGRNDSFPAYALAVGYNTAFTPTLANEMHVGMVHADKFQRSIYGNIFGIPAQYGIGGVPQVAEQRRYPSHHHQWFDPYWRRQFHPDDSNCLQHRRVGQRDQGSSRPHLQDRHSSRRSGSEHLTAAAGTRKLHLQWAVLRYPKQK